MDKIVIDEDKIEELLSRGTEDIVNRDELKAMLISGRQLRVKFGIDPTGPKIHIGRAIPIRKLREFQKLGHQVVLIVGDFTAQIGDASDKTEKRPILTRAKIDENLQDYKSQLGKILDMSRVEFCYNNDWLGSLTFSEVAKMAEVFSVQQMLARRNFKDRYDNGVEISLREFLYPIMQGYDSVAVKSDVEIGGFDQLFNLKAGRTLQEFFGQPKQQIMTVQMLDGTDGRKMSTSWNNIITVVDDRDTMFGMIMSVHDDLIIKYFTLCTDLSLAEIDVISQDIKNGSNPRDAKMRLASEIVKSFHGEMEAVRAQNSFIETFQKGGIPDVIDEYHIAPGALLGDVLVDKQVIESKTQWRRLAEDGAVSIHEGEVVTDPKAEAISAVYKIGKKRFVKLVVD